MRNLLFRLGALTLFVVACGSDASEDAMGEPPDTAPGVENPLPDAATSGGTGAAPTSIDDDGGGGAGGAPDESGDGGGTSADGRGDGESNDAEEPEVLAAEPCDLSAPFEAPVAAFTGSMDADGLTFSADGNTAYISGAGPGGRDIYVSTRPQGGNFGPPQLLAPVNTNFMERAPALAPDGRLYFTKQEPSGWLNIGRAQGIPPNFTGVEAVPAPISSQWQDEDPFWWGNNTLYFVSEVENQGSHRDIFRAAWDATTGTFSNRTNVANVNSGAEEFHPVLSPDGLTLYFSSRRGGGIGNDTSGDVYMARRSSTDFDFPETPPVNLWGLNTTGIDYPVTVSANGCTLYFASNEETGLSDSQNFRLYEAKRGESTPAQVTLRLNILGQGSVTQAPFNCGPNNTGTCSASAPPDTTMIVNASGPAVWTGSCTGHGGPPSTDGVLTFAQNAVCTIKFPDGNLVGHGGLCSLPMDCRQGLDCVNNTCDGECDLSAPFEAPVAAFTGSMDADGLTFSADGQRAYISGGGPGGRDIYVAIRGPNGNFGTPELVTALNTPFTERAPSLSPDGKLYFTKQASNGSFDIGRAVGTAPGFTGTEVVPAPISSSGQEEEDPFWWGNNTLYFGSQIDGADLWVTTWSGTTFSPPTLVEGESVNTGAFWEFRPVLSPDGLTLYFGSNRYGIGLDRSGDVYMARRAALGAPFDEFANLYGLNSTAVDYPVAVSANGCTLYFASQEESALTGGTSYRLYQAMRGTSTPSQVTLRLNILGQGSVTTSPFNCGPGNTGTCSASAPPDTTSILFATSPAEWTGSCTGNGGTPSDDGVVVYSQNAVCTIKFPGASLVGEGGLCSLSRDCQAGLTCNNGTCSCAPGAHCSEQGDTCSADTDCQTGLVCWLEGARHFDKPGGTGVCAPQICRTSVVAGGCGDLTQPCGRCEGTPRPCTTNADCVSGEVCGTDNGDAFGLAPDGDFCWPPDCNVPATTPARCGTVDSACGLCDCSANCAGRACGDPTDDLCGGECTGLCDDHEPCTNSLDCPAGSVCGLGIGPRYGLPAGTNACWPADCADQDPAEPNGGVDPQRCGTSPPCVPTCESGDTGPNGCGGFCGDCTAGEVRQDTGVCAPPVTFFHRSGVDLPEPFDPMPTDEVGATPGAFSVTDRGNASYSIGLQVPPGRLGVQPNLALLYVSTKADGMLGIGWSLTGLSTITRCRKVVDIGGVASPLTFGSRDQFCLDGQALKQAGEGDYGDDGVEYRTEIDTFSKVMSNGSATDANGNYVGPAWFRVWTKDGRILTYGRSGLSKVVVDGSPVARVWGLNRVEDRAGNYLDIAYKNNQSVRVAFTNGNAERIDTGELLPDVISYGGNRAAATAGLSGRSHSRFVRFVYEKRPDPTHHYVAGVQGYSVRRLVRIDTRVGDELVKSYELSYEPQENQLDLAPSQLESVRECGVDADGTRRCLNPTTFQYFEPTSFGSARTIRSWGVRPAIAILDQNGDGLDDVAVLSPVADNAGGWRFNAFVESPTPVDVSDGLPFTTLSSGGISAKCVGQDSVIDLNRDGRDDLVDLCEPRAYLATPNGFEQVPINVPDTGATSKRFADVNGDGLRDLVACHGPSAIEYMINSGSDFLPPVGFNNIQTNGLITSCDDFMMVDLDGDGDDEFVMGRSVVPINPPTGPRYVATGMMELVTAPGDMGPVSSWIRVGPDLPPVSHGSDGSRVVPYRMLDFNGDGLKDFLAVDGSGIKYWMNTGAGFTVQRMSTRLAPGTIGLPSGFDKAIVMDRDGDGRDDLILPPIWYRLAKPGVVEVGGSLGLPGDFGGLNVDARARGMPADFDGDGSHEIFYLDDWTSQSSSTLRYVESAASGKARLLHRAIDGLGQRSTAEYEGLYDPPIDARHPLPPETRNWVQTLTPSAWTCQPTTTTRCLNKVGPLVSTSRSAQIFPDGQPTSAGPTIFYQYFGPRMGLGGRGFLGFSQRIVENPLSRTNTAFHNDDFRLVGHPKISETRLVSAAPSPLGNEERFEVTTFDWGIFESGAARPFPFLLNQTHTVYDGFTAHAVVARTEVSREPPDAFGNELSHTVRTSSQHGLVDETIVSTSPVFPNTTSWIVGLPDTRVITGTRNEESRRRVLDYEYDLGRMLLTSVERHGGPLGATDPTQHRITSFVPDEFGNLEEACVDGQGGPARCTRILSRDAENIFLREVRDAENMVSEYIFAVDDGQPIAVSDPNGIQSERTTDAFGRLQQVRTPVAEGSVTYSGRTRSGTSFQDVVIDGAMAVTRNFVGEGAEVSIFDAFGRLVQTQTPGFDGAVVHQDSQYDELGRLVAVSAPHVPTNDAEGLTVFDYDGVGRLAKVTQPDGTATEYFYTNVQAASVTYSFNIGENAASLSVVKLPRGNIRMTVRDPLGQISRTAEAAGLGRSNETHTSFVRGPFGAVHQVMAPQGTTTYEIDDWGRARSFIDPALGEQQFVYNGFDELVHETDARGEDDFYEYDDLGRLIEKRDEDGDVIARWEFDGDPELNQQGRLVASWRRATTGSDTGTWILNHFDEQGLPSAAEYHVGATLGDRNGGDAFVGEYIYDDEVPGRLSAIAYPSNGGEFRVGYEYDDVSGAIRRAFQADGEGNEIAELWTLVSADEGYRLGSEEFGNGVVSTRTYYDPVECLNQPSRSCAGRLKDITTQFPTETPFYDVRHEWDQNGNLAELGSLRHEYDSLDRLVREHVVISSGGLGQQDVTVAEYAYNNAGDITSKTGVGTYSYEPRSPGAGSELHSVGDTTYLYDANGNQTERSGSLAHGGYQSFEYNDFDMPHRVTSGTGIQTVTTLEYTSSGQRVREDTTSPGIATERVYIGDIYQRTESTLQPTVEHRYKVLVGSRQVAEVVRHGSNDINPDVFYLHDDHLGSVTAITDPDEAVETRSYGAFGTMTATSEGAPSGVRSSFTGHDQDSALGLVNARGRLYDPQIGRFLSADPYTGNPLSSQGWNRYAYVENNPLTFTDPSGFLLVCQNEGTSQMTCNYRPDSGSGGGGGSGDPYDYGRRQAEEAYWRAMQMNWGFARGMEWAEKEREKAQRQAEAARRGQQNAQNSADAARSEAEAQRRHEEMQQGMGRGQAAANAGQPRPGYGQPTLGGPAPPRRGNELAGGPAGVAVVACALNPVCAITMAAIVGGAGWLGYAVWNAVDSADKGGDADDADDRYTDRIGKIARDASETLGRKVTEREIKDAIHKVKNEGLGRGGPVRNPDVSVDPSGDVKPKLPDGQLGDSIGNIYDHLGGG